MKMHWIDQEIVKRGQTVDGIAGELQRILTYGNLDYIHQCLTNYKAKNLMELSVRMHSTLKELEVKGVRK